MKNKEKLFLISCFVILLMVWLFPDIAFAESLRDTLNPSNPAQKWIFDIWRFSLSAINIFVLAALIFIAFANILRININVYAIKKILPSLILGVILANFSLFISRLIIDFATVLMLEFAGKPSDLSENLIAAFGFTTFFQQQEGILFLVIGATAIISIGAITGFGVLLGAFFFALILALIPTAFITILSFLLYIRIIAIYVLTAVSPLAMISIGFPLTANYFKKWWGLFANWAFMAPVVFFLIRIAGFIQQQTGDKPTILTYALSIGLLYIAVQVPFKMGGTIMSSWANLGRLVTGTGKGGFFAGKFGEVRQEMGARAALRARTIPGIKQVMEYAERARGRRLGYAEVAKTIAEEQVKEGKRAILWNKNLDNQKGISKLRRNDYLEFGSTLSNSAMKDEELGKWIISGGPEALEGASPEARRRHFSAIDALARRKRFAYTPEDRENATRVLDSLKPYIEDITDLSIQDKAEPGKQQIISEKPLSPKEYALNDPYLMGGLPQEMNDSIERKRRQAIKNNLAGYPTTTITGISDAIERGESDEKIATDFARDVIEIVPLSDAVKKAKNAAETAIQNSLEQKASETVNIALELKPVIQSEGFKGKTIENIKNLLNEINQEGITGDRIDRGIKALAGLPKSTPLPEELKKNPQRLIRSLDSTLRAGHILEHYKANNFSLDKIQPENVRIPTRLALQKEWEVEKVKNTLKGTFGNEIPNDVRRMITDNEEPVKKLKQTIRTSIDTLVKISAPNAKLDTSDYDKVINKLLNHVSENIDKTKGTTKNIDTLLKENATQISQAILGEFDNLEKIKSAREQTTKSPSGT